MSQVKSCLFTIHIDELVALYIPIHKWWKSVMKFWCFLINVDVPKVLKMSPHFQKWWDKFPLIWKLGRTLLTTICFVVVVDFLVDIQWFLTKLTFLTNMAILKKLFWTDMKLLQYYLCGRRPEYTGGIHCPLSKLTTWPPHITELGIT